VRILIQWALSQPKNWDSIDSSKWSNTPVKADPTNRSDLQLDNSKGWINKLCVQGVEFVGDHYCVEHVAPDEIKVIVWTDTDDHYAHVWTFKTLRPDPKFWGAINTNQKKIVYCEPGSKRWNNTEKSNIDVKPWDSFVIPTKDVRHSKPLSDEEYLEHEGKLSKHGWREWTELVDPIDIDENGRVKEQRAQGRYPVPDGTKTYYASTTGEATDIHSADQELSLAIGTGSPATSAASIKKSNEELAFVFTTPLGNPGSSAWPTGSYRYQIDCSTVGADITYGLLTIGEALGHFARVDSGLTTDLETKTQVDSAYSGTGLNLATTGSVSWSTGNTSDRFECVIAAGNIHTKNDQTLELQLNESDDYADGPWISELTTTANTATADADSINTTVANGPAKTTTANVPIADADSIDVIVQSQELTATATVPVTDVDSINATVQNQELVATATVSIADVDSINATVQSQALIAAAIVPVADVDSINATVANGPAKTTTAIVPTADADSINATVQIQVIELTAEAATASADVDSISATVQNQALTVGAATPIADVDSIDATVDKKSALIAVAVVPIADVDSINATVANGPAKTATANVPVVDVDSIDAIVVNGPAKTTTANVPIADVDSISATVQNQELVVVAIVPTADVDSIDATVVNGPAKVAIAEISVADVDSIDATVQNQELIAVAVIPTADVDSIDATAVIEIVELFVFADPTPVVNAIAANPSVLIPIKIYRFNSTVTEKTLAKSSVITKITKIAKL
jgi:hypothetical protein